MGTHTNRKHQYKKNYLTDVIFRIDFSTGNFINSESSQFRDELSKLFSKFEIKHNKNFFVNLKNDQLTSDQKESTSWIYTNDVDRFILQVEEKSLIIHDQAYHSHRKFRNHLEKVLNIYTKCFRDIEIERCGLRYINQINIDQPMPYKLDGFIDQRLLHIINFNPEGSKILRSMASTEFIINEEEGVKLLFKYGVFNSVYPSPPIKKEFILDFDCYTNFLEKPQDVLNFFDNYNKTIAIYFENSIGDKLRKELHEESPHE